VRIDVVAAIIRKNDEILITQRLDGAHLARFWEFPGGKVEAGESLEVALQREIQEELGIKIRVGDEFFTIDYEYPAKSLRLHFFNCAVLEGDAQALHVADLRWIKLQDIGVYQFPPADTDLIRKLRSSF
jgi:8-oxo-dGTP diphosphatase